MYNTPLIVLLQIFLIWALVIWVYYLGSSGFVEGTGAWAVQMAETENRKHSASGKKVFVGLSRL
jgi:hypothetical protein